MAQTSSLAALYGLRGQGTTPGAMDIGVLSRAYGRGPAGPFDISYPFMGLALGRSIRSFRENAEVTALLEEAQKRELPAKWAAAVQTDPELATSAPKMVNWMMTNAPEMLGKMGDIFGAYRAAAEAKRTETLTQPEKGRIEAETGLFGARAGEAGARTGLLGEQTITEKERRPALVGELWARGGAEKALAGLRGEQEITEREKRPVSLAEIEAGTKRWKALAERLRAETGKIGKETELLGKESRFRTPSPMFNLLTNAMVTHYWPMAEANLPEEKKLKGMATFTDPMTGKPDEAKMRATLPPEVQREYDEVKLRAEELVSQGTNPTQAFRQAYEEVTGRAAAAPSAARPPVVFK
jgi:hypothetical protein